jgi:hypothetical protein
MYLYSSLYLFINFYHHLYNSPFHLKILKFVYQKAQYFIFYEYKDTQHHQFLQIFHKGPFLPGFILNA